MVQGFGRLSILVAAAFVGCGGGSASNDATGGDGAGSPSSVAFHAEAAALPDFTYDTGYLPEASPIQVRLELVTAGGLTADAEARVGGSSAAPILSGKAGSGRYQFGADFVFAATAKIDIAGLKYEGPISEGTDLRIAFGGEQTFDPFSVGTPVTVVAEVPETLVAEVPISALPGASGTLILHVSGTLTSTYVGACAAISPGPDSKAQYRAQATTTGDLIVKPSIVLEIGICPMACRTETLPAFDIPVHIPETPLALDLGTLAVTPAGGAVDGGGSLATVGSCDDVAPPTDVVGGDTAGGDTPTPDGHGGDGGGPDGHPTDAVLPDAPGPDAALPDVHAPDGALPDAPLPDAPAPDGTGPDAAAPDLPGRDTAAPEVAPACAATCDGCCVGDDCYPGGDSALCGSGGAACRDCGAGRACVGGTCEAAPDYCPGYTGDHPCCVAGDPCGFAGNGFCDCDQACDWDAAECAALACAASCPGCCQDGSCLPGDDLLACGQGGAACVPCAEGLLCAANGECLGCQDGASCPPGERCVDNRCVPETAWCPGYGGENACCHTDNPCNWDDDGYCDCDATCGWDELDCGIDPDALYDVRLISADVLLPAPEGGFDEGGGLPDLFVTLRATVGGVSVESDSYVQYDTLSGVWDYAVLSAIPAGDILYHGLGFVVSDDDSPAPSEYITSCGFLVPLAALSGDDYDPCSDFGEARVILRLTRTP